MQSQVYNFEMFLILEVHKILKCLADFKFSKCSFLNLLEVKAISAKTDFALYGGCTSFLHNDSKP